VLSHGTYTTVDDPNGVATSPAGIDGRGDIVGFYVAINPFHIYGFLLSPG